MASPSFGPSEHTIRILLAGAEQGSSAARDALLMFWVAGSFETLPPGLSAQVEGFLRATGYLVREVGAEKSMLAPSLPPLPKLPPRKPEGFGITPWSPEIDPVLGPLLRWLGPPVKGVLPRAGIGATPIEDVVGLLKWAVSGEPQKPTPLPAVTVPGVQPTRPPIKAAEQLAEDPAEALLSHLLSAMPFADPQQVANIRSVLAQLKAENWGWVASYILGTPEKGWERGFWTAVGRLPGSEKLRGATAEAAETLAWQAQGIKVPASQLKSYGPQMLGRPLTLAELTFLAGGANADVSLLPADFKQYYRYWKQEGVAFTEGEFLAALQEYAANEAWPVELRDEFLKDAPKLFRDYIDRQKMRFAQAEADAMDMARYREAIKAGLMLEIDLPEFRQHAFLTPQAFLATETPKRIATLKDKAEKERLVEAIAMQADPRARMAVALAAVGLPVDLISEKTLRLRGPGESLADYEKYLRGLAEQIRPQLKDKVSVDEFIGFVLGEQRKADEALAAQERIIAALNPLEQARAAAEKLKVALPISAFAWQEGTTWAEYEADTEKLLDALGLGSRKEIVKKYIFEQEWRKQEATVLGQELRPQVEQFITSQLLRLSPGERDLAGAAMRAGPLVGQLTALWKAKRVAFAGIAPGMMAGEEGLFKGWLGAQDPLALIPSLSAQPQAKLAAPGRFVRTVQLPGLPPQRR